jgi:hypothetical protein
MNQDDATTKLRWTAEMQRLLKALHDESEEFSLRVINEEPSLFVPYFRVVQGPDGRDDWAQCPRCGEVVKNRKGRGPGLHWTIKHESPSLLE